MFEIASKSKVNRSSLKLQRKDKKGKCRFSFRCSLGKAKRYFGFCHAASGKDLVLVLSAELYRRYEMFKFLRLICITVASVLIACAVPTAPASPAVPEIKPSPTPVVVTGNFVERLSSYIEGKKLNFIPVSGQSELEGNNWGGVRIEAYRSTSVEVKVVDTVNAFNEVVVLDWSEVTPGEIFSQALVGGGKSVCVLVTNLVEDGPRITLIPGPC